MKIDDIQVYHDTMKGTATVSGAESSDDAWFAADSFLAFFTDDDDGMVYVIKDGQSVKDPNEDGEYVFQVVQIASRQDEVQDEDKVRACDRCKEEKEVRWVPSLGLLCEHCERDLDEQFPMEGIDFAATPTQVLDDEMPF